jgi:ABC-type dipeptide/oligopeptide/nickel transport system ATPase component
LASSMRPNTLLHLPNSRTRGAHAGPQASNGPTSGPVVTVRDLRVQAHNSRATTELLHGVSLDVEVGQMHGLVGETGSGKSITAAAIMGLLPKGVAITEGSIKLGDQELVGLDQKSLHELRGPSFGMIFQNPRTALHPMYSVSKQMNRVLEAHTAMNKRERIDRIMSYLNLVGIPDPGRIAHSFPHELSGGLAQRVVIATSLLCDPTFLIADEPTTGLDATVQRQILELLARLQAELNLSVLMITHDLSIVAQYCDRVSVMYGGDVVEEGPVRQVMRAPQAAYTRNLLRSSRLEFVTQRDRVSA